MSGGVDSSLAAALLVEQGWEVVGVTMKLHGYADTGQLRPDRACCDLSAYADARRVCDRLGVPHLVVDLVEEFRREVLDDFAAEYLAGRTPNPCVRCNTRLKWEHLERRARSLGAGWLATGHYARVFAGADGAELHRGLDSAKDQSYALWGLPRERLERTLLPLGGLGKAEVRERARGLGLATADKAESQDICFVPDGDYGAFLRHHAPEAMAAGAGGELIGPDGAVAGHHRGLAHYTVGQRRGLGRAFGRPVYVRALDPATNRVLLGEEQDLYGRDLVAERVNWLIDPPGEPFRCLGAIRYQDRGSACVVQAEGSRLRLRFDEPRRAITPGQSLVLYAGSRVLGGGIIAHGEQEGS
jgi:tRNA-uridine 2-sulfurtransferase